MKLGDFKGDQKYFEIILKASKKNHGNLESSSTNVHMVGRDLLRSFSKLLYLQFCVSSD